MTKLFKSLRFLKHVIHSISKILMIHSNSNIAILKNKRLLLSFPY